MGLKSPMGRTAADWHLAKQRLMFQERLHGETGGSSPSRCLKAASPVRDAWSSPTALKMHATTRSYFNHQEHTQKQGALAHSLQDWSTEMHDTRISRPPPPGGLSAHQN